MIPKTILQKKVAELSSTLPAITEEQTNYAFMKYFKEYAVLSRRSLYCLECGHVWRESGQEKFCVCTNCGTKLDIYDRYNGSLSDSYYYSIITTHKEWQVIRMFEVNQYMRKKQKVRYSIFEVLQHWINEKGKVVSMSIKTSSYGWNGVQWSYGSAMEVKPSSFKESNNYGISAHVTYPKKKILPEIKRNGYKGNLHGFNANKFFSSILTDRTVETLLKTNQISLFTRQITYPDKIKEYWPSVRICLRNKYIVKDAGDWLDQMRLLKFFGKDILSKKYVCPVDLNAEHARYIKKKQAVDKIRMIAERKAKAKEEEIEFQKKAKRFKGLEFEENGIKIIFLETVEDIMLEGEFHKHCVFTNEYHKEKDSLILSARMNDIPLETIEVSLSQMKVVQARGSGNTSTEHHKQILAIMNKNMSIIRKRYKQKLAV